MSAQQRRADAIAAIQKAIHTWGDLHGVETEFFPVEDLAERLFNLQPAYCPYDSGCHDEDCPCPNCEQGRAEASGGEESEYDPPCGDSECRQYHCGQCSQHSGQTGHFTTLCQVTRQWVNAHFCCPGACSLADEEKGVID